MGGTDITSSLKWSGTTGTLTISNVTGNVYVNITAISESGSGDVGSSDPEVGTTTTLGDNAQTTVTIIDKFSDFNFVDGKMLSTSGGSSCVLKDGTSRATSITQVMKITGGATLNFNPVITGLQWALVEFTAKPCSTSTFNPNGEKAAAWLTASKTTHANTKYIAVNFNRGSGSFTASELSLLKNAITVS
jgi:hypothetical protein